MTWLQAWDGNTLRFAIFILVLLIMTGLETYMPRRARRHERSRRWFTNFSVLASDFLAVALVTLVLPVTATLVAAWAGHNRWGLFNLVGWPVWLEWVLGFLVLDFVIWAQHLVTHKVPFLWRVHRVHHADEDLDASTAVRFHPFEIVFSLFVKAGAVLLLGPAALLVALFEATINGSALFNHANWHMPEKIDRYVRLILVTPDMHRVHHSANGEETDSNYGFALSIWDRLFRVYTDQPAAGHEKMILGLGEWQEAQATRLGWTLWLPFIGPPRKEKRPD